MKQSKPNFAARTLLLLSLLFSVFEAEGANGANLKVSFETIMKDSEIIFAVAANSPNQVKAFGFDISYDPKLLSYLRFDRTGTLTEDFSYVFVNEPIDGQLNIIGFDAGRNTIPQESSGTLVHLVFQILAEGVYTLTPANLKDDILNWTVMPGTAERFEPDENMRLLRIIDRPMIRNFHKPGDEDWGWFYGIPGEIFVVQTTALGPRCDTVIEVVGADGSVLASKNAAGVGEDEILTWKTPEDAIYYIRIRHADPEAFGEHTGYTLRIQYPKGDAYEPDDLPDKARVIAVNGGAQQRTFYDENDQDWSIFYGSAGAAYKIETVDTSSAYDVQIDLFVFDHGRKKLLESGNDGGAGHDEVIIWTCPADDRYYVRVTPAGFSQTRKVRTTSDGYKLQITRETSEFGHLYGQVKNAVTDEPLRDVIIKTDSASSGISRSDGYYDVFNLPIGSNAAISAGKEGVSPDCGSVYIGQPPTRYDIRLFSCSGDVNGNGRITAEDARCAFQKFMGQCPACTTECLLESCGVPFVCCDVNGDGACTAADALCIFQKYMNRPSCLD